MKKVVLYTTERCPYCLRAKDLLTAKGVAFEEIRVDTDNMMRKQMEERTGRRTVPQIFIGEKHVGGFDDLKALHERHELNAWLSD